MAWQAVAGGANGVLFWCFHHPYWKLSAEDFAQFQSDYAAVGAEVREFIPILLLPEAEERILSVPATMSARVWTDAGRTYLLVCNLTREDVAGDIWLSGWYASLQRLLDGGESEVDGGRVPVTLPPLGVGLFALTD